MEIIPVIDIRHGLAVHAVKGERARYRPLETRLATSADPIEVARGIYDYFPFPTLYVADLDGIEGGAAESALQRRLVAEWRGASVWIDDGAHAPPARATGTVRDKRVSVIGSETLPPRMPRPARAKVVADDADVAPMPAASAWDAAWHRDDWILSLDFHDDELLGPEWLIEEPSLWPSRVIAMTVRRVGTGAGADLDTVARVAKLAIDSRVYAAGGVRDRSDLQALSAAGASGALVATALHAGMLKAGELAELAGL